MTLTIDTKDSELTTQDSPKTVRDALGLRQPEMAALFGMSDFGYVQWEDGKRSPGKPAWRLLFLLETGGEDTLSALRKYPS